MVARVSKGKNKKNKHENDPSLEKQKLEPIFNLPIGPPKRIHLEERSEPPILASRRPSYTKRSRIVVVLLELRDHFIATLALLSLGGVLHFILTDVWGDPRFFDELPVRYVIDAGDIAVIATFFIIMIMKLFTMDRK